MFTISFISSVDCQGIVEGGPMAGLLFQIFHDKYSKVFTALLVLKKFAFALF